MRGPDLPCRSAGGDYTDSTHDQQAFAVKRPGQRPGLTVMPFGGRPPRREGGRNANIQPLAHSQPVSWRWSSE